MAIMNTQRERMLAGELYDPGDPELIAARLLARTRCHELNTSQPHDESRRRDVLKRLFAQGGDSVTLEPPFRCDYGSNIYLGNNVYFNFDCVILDVCDVRIGSSVFIAPGVHIYTATHPIDHELRRTQESGKPVAIGDDVWIGGGAIICPGVTIGDRTVIGAGSVVTKAIPAGVVAAGNPARVIREIE